MISGAAVVKVRANNAADIGSGHLPQLARVKKIGRAKCPAESK
jgi:hypothetical protein